MRPDLGTQDKFRKEEGTGHLPLRLVALADSQHSIADQVVRADEHQDKWVSHMIPSAPSPRCSTQAGCQTVSG